MGPRSESFSHQLDEGTWLNLGSMVQRRRVVKIPVPRKSLHVSIVYLEAASEKVKFNNMEYENGKKSIYLGQ